MLGSLLKIFGRGFLHWFTQRTSACSLVVSVVVLSVSNDLFFWAWSFSIDFGSFRSRGSHAGERLHA